MNLYDGTTDPKHHLSNFKSRMYLTDASDATRCKAFPTTLSKATMKWFNSLPPRSVTSFEDLSRKFLMWFSIQKDKVKHAPSLLGVEQEVGELLRDYMKRFNKACLEIQDLPTEAVIMGLVNRLREGPFSQSISKRHPASLSDIQERAEKYINMEENARLREPRGGLTKSSRKRYLKRVHQVGSESPDLPTISFTKEDEQGVIPGYDYPVVITMILEKCPSPQNASRPGEFSQHPFQTRVRQIRVGRKGVKGLP
ncbi:uncharacterized protein [Arachis hypogaea]|uniref:uncharacterized protein n=1 Tax=Arachis hypogaea TaxID=3818 RepID=UPI000DECAC10|nr:uncharacterized protein LOC112805368 [Arachis hypogaea]